MELETFLKDVVLIVGSITVFFIVSFLGLLLAALIKNNPVSAIIGSTVSCSVGGLVFFGPQGMFIGALMGIVSAIIMLSYE